MTTEQDKEIQIGEEGRWEALVEAVATGKLGFFDLVESTAPLLFSEGDYEGFVAFSRATIMLLRDPRIAVRVAAEIDRKAKEHGAIININDIQRVIRSKDGPRRIEKLGQIAGEMYGDGPSLITGATFDECLAQHQKLIKHVENLWDDACRHYREKRFPLATFLAILAIEEVGKLGRLWYDLLAWDRPLTPLTTDHKNLGLLGKDHRKKHFMAVVPGAVINARLDRILSVQKLKQLLQDVESGKLEELRQACLYIDVVDGVAVTPESRIDADTAKFFTVLAGELWAEILGHFPWDFKKMIDKVTAYEIEIGYKRADVERT